MAQRLEPSRNVPAERRGWENSVGENFGYLPLRNRVKVPQMADFRRVKVPEFLKKSRAISTRSGIEKKGRDSAGRGPRGEDAEEEDEYDHIQKEREPRSIQSLVYFRTFCTSYTFGNARYTARIPRDFFNLLTQLVGIVYLVYLQKGQQMSRHLLGCGALMAARNKILDKSSFVFTTQREGHEEARKTSEAKSTEVDDIQRAGLYRAPSWEGEVEVPGDYHVSNSRHGRGASEEGLPFAAAIGVLKLSRCGAYASVSVGGWVAEAVGGERCAFAAGGEHWIIGGWRRVIALVTGEGVVVAGAFARIDAVDIERRRWRGDPGKVLALSTPRSSSEEVGQRAQARSDRSSRGMGRIVASSLQGLALSGDVVGEHWHGRGGGAEESCHGRETSRGHRVTDSVTRK
ncbi:hypothetical protein DFH06DRAFT_1147721 [Mycena polygramma]|nr:hypothetical protein DFH06DRAFT_1147721 [Mycena polygramma]